MCFCFCFFVFFLCFCLCFCPMLVLCTDRPNGHPAACAQKTTIHLPAPARTPNRWALSLLEPPSLGCVSVSTNEPFGSPVDTSFLAFLKGGKQISTPRREKPSCGNHFLQAAARYRHACHGNVWISYVENVIN